ncbi:hypothetical protein [Prescottella equi]|uniref:hypothetical protein n=1 Tax=Rhodococcus hoagii TaxID=43767 RepID=UPI002741136C|nr:hypothetical protein [Prescottella equi]MDP8015155.1 hypothetical protein [Prescottella equi]
MRELADEIARLRCISTRAIRHRPQRAIVRRDPAGTARAAPPDRAGPDASDAPA